MLDSIAALRDAIKHCHHSQAELARRIGVRRSTVNNWLNGHARISYFYAVKIELAVSGVVKREQLAPHAQFTRNPHATDWNSLRTENYEDVSSHQSTSQFSISERLQQAKIFADKLDKRQGQRTDLQLRRNCDEVHGRTDVYIAQKYGFKNKDSYRRALKVFTSGCKELIAAFQKGDVAVSTAALIATLPEEEQRHIVILGKKAMTAAALKIRQDKQKNQRLFVQ